MSLRAADMVPNYELKSYQSLLNFAKKTHDMEIIKWLVQYGARVDNDFVSYIITPPNCYCIKELVSHIFEFNKNVELVQEIFLKLVKSCCRGPMVVNFLNLLLDHTFPINDYINDSCDYYRDGYTPLQLSIKYEIYDFVLLLLERGADIHKKTMKGASCLWLAINHKNCSILESLLKKGARVNERIWTQNGPTALHEACELGESSETIRMLLEYGADVNVLAANKKTPLMIAIRSDAAAHEEILIKELALLSFQKRPICSRNLNSIKRKRFLKNMFKDCLEELSRMMDHKVYENLSLYDVYKMRDRRKMLSLLTKNDSFVEAFNLSWDTESFEYYGKDLDDMLEEAAERRDVLKREEEKLYSIFKNHLPQLAIFKIAYFANGVKICEVCTPFFMKSLK